MPFLLDMYCGAGGAAKGYADAGFTVVGVDITPQPHFPYDFIQSDALDFAARYGHHFEAIHASPPCQSHTVMRSLHNAKSHVDLIPATRALLSRLGRPYVIENVEGAPLVDPITLCGTMFGLGCERAELQRHRLFECSFPVPQPPCKHGDKEATIGVYGGHVRNRKRRAEGNTHRGIYDFTPAEGREAMGIDWMTLLELSQAIPPAYTRYIGDFLKLAVQTKPEKETTMENEQAPVPAVSEQTEILMTVRAAIAKLPGFGACIKDDKVHVISASGETFRLKVY